MFGLFVFSKFQYSVNLNSFRFLYVFRFACVIFRELLIIPFFKEL
jgi:hypothetical protein